MREVRVAAASDLQYALADITKLFETQNPDVKVSLTFGSSGKFFTQIQQGAPFDIFYSADESYPAQLEKDGLLEPKTRKLYAVGRVVVWVSSRLGLDVAKLGPKVLLDSKIQRIAIANPEHAPYGQAAISLLDGLGLTADLKSKFVYGENISQTAQLALAGADAGILALSVVKTPAMEQAGKYWLAPLEAHKRLNQNYAILKGQARPEVGAFYNFMETYEARKIFVHYGFRLPAQP